jgi:crossover junction endodeoxyribonuclease RuvC
MTVAERTITVFGIDPGTAATGYGVICCRDNTVRWVDSGVIAPDAGADLADRLTAIYDGLLGKLDQHKPSTVCVEQAFYAKNVHTTLILGHARGVALLAARRADARILEFSPREVKKAVVGNGNAEKEQVAYMVKVLLSPPPANMRPDACDALAIALCGYYNHRGAEQMLRAAVAARAGAA